MMTAKEFAELNFFKRLSFRADWAGCDRLHIIGYHQGINMVLLTGSRHLGGTSWNANQYADAGYTLLAISLGNGHVCFPPSSLTANEIAITVSMSKSRDWPHACPRCAGPALNMAVRWDCSNGCWK